MNYYEARQVADGPMAGKWHWTCFNRRIGTYRTGACSPDEPCSCGSNILDKADCPLCDGRGVVPKANPCAHDTPEEACDHQLDYILAGGVVRHETSWTSCQAKDATGSYCPNPAKVFLDFERDQSAGMTVCSDHDHDETLTSTFTDGRRGKPWKQISSW